jgi:hypothetical protein
MHYSPSADSTFVHNIISRHLNIRLSPQDAGRSNLETPGDLAKSVSGALLQIDNANVVLYRLLRNYVDLLEASSHGGWTQAEDNNVRAVVCELLGAGWNFQTLER